MSKANANGIQIEYETFGDRSGRPLLLIMGLGQQLTEWSEEVLKQLADEGHFVIVYDNRDTGLSSKIEEGGEKFKVPYTFNDMSDDAVGLLDALGIKKTHICGISMGGAIAQTIALSHPSNLLSLILIYTPTYNPNLPQPKPKIMNLLNSPPVTDRNAYVERATNRFRIISGTRLSLR